MLKNVNPVLLIAGVVVVLGLASFVIIRQVTAPGETVNTTFISAEDKAEKARGADKGAAAKDTREESPGMQP